MNLSKRAEVNFNKGDYDKAIADYTLALPNPSVKDAALCGRAKAYIEKGDFTKARADVNEALKLGSPSNQVRELDAELKKKGY